MIGKEKAVVRQLTACQNVNPVAYILWNWKDVPIVSVKMASGGQTHEVVYSLRVSSWTEGNGPQLFMKAWS
jgi:hypothetical protein